MILEFFLKNDKDNACEKASELCDSFGIHDCKSEAFYDRVNDALGFYDTHGMASNSPVVDYEDRMKMGSASSPAAARFLEYRKKITYLEETDGWHAFVENSRKFINNSSLVTSFMKALWWLHVGPLPSTAREHFEYMCIKRNLFKDYSSEYALIKPDEQTKELVRDLEKKSGILIEDAMSHLLAWFGHFFTKNSARFEGRPGEAYTYPPDTKYIPGYVEMVSNGIKHNEEGRQELVWYASGTYDPAFSYLHDRLHYTKIDQHIRYTIKELARAAVEADISNIEFINQTWRNDPDIVALLSNNR